MTLQAPALTAGSPRAVLVSTMRNEGPYILEWLCHHRAVGFTDVIVCSNDCVDGSPELLDALDEEGLLRHLPCRPGPEDAPQLFAYRTAEPVWRDLEPEWTMVLDADEFLNIHVGAGCLADLFAAAPEATAFLINWRVFGDSGRPAWAPNVVGRFTEAARRQDAVNLSFKTLFREWDAYERPLLPHGPGYARPETLARLRPVDGGGRPLGEAYARSEGFLQSDPSRVDFALAQVNHYNTRSFDDYLVKHQRGGGLTAEPFDLDWWWGAFNKNDETDLSLRRARPNLDQAVDALLARRSIRVAYDRCLQLYGEHVAALRAQRA